MTINGGQPHRVGYAGHAFKITVRKRGSADRITIGWTNTASSTASLCSLESNPAWTDARCEPVTNKETGE